MYSSRRGWLGARRFGADFLLAKLDARQQELADGFQRPGEQVTQPIRLEGQSLVDAAPVGATELDCDVHQVPLGGEEVVMRAELPRGLTGGGQSAAGPTGPGSESAERSGAVRVGLETAHGGEPSFAIHRSGQHDVKLPEHVPGGPLDPLRAAPGPTVIGCRVVVRVGARRCEEVPTALVCTLATRSPAVQASATRTDRMLELAMAIGAFDDQR